MSGSYSLLENDLCSMICDWILVKYISQWIASAHSFAHKGPLYGLVQPVHYWTDCSCYDLPEHCVSTQNSITHISSFMCTAVTVHFRLMLLYLWRHLLLRGLLCLIRIINCNLGAAFSLQLFWYCWQLLGWCHSQIRKANNLPTARCWKIICVWSHKLHMHKRCVHVATVGSKYNLSVTCTGLLQSTDTHIQFYLVMHFATVSY